MFKEIFKQARIASILLVLLSLLTGLFYPLLITGIAQLAFPWKANGSLIYKNNKMIGSLLIGQFFLSPKYFWGRPSATDPFPYNSANSSGSNFGTVNQEFLNQVKLRINYLKKFDPQNNGLIPVDLITASGSGLDPEISPEAALYQVERIAKARGISKEVIENLVKKSIKKRYLGIFGEPRINVLEINLILDRLVNVRTA